jgi:hypothetical protein
MVKKEFLRLPLSELDPKYCDVIVERWEKFTGKKAVLISSSERGGTIDAERQ